MWCVNSLSSAAFGSSPLRRSHATSRKRRLLRELLDRVAAVLEDALVAVDERDGRLARRGVRERRVVGHEAEVVVTHLDLPQVEGPDRPVLDGQLVALPGAVVRDRDRVFFGHTFLPKSAWRTAENSMPAPRRHRERRRACIESPSMNLKRHFGEALTLVAAAVLCALVANALARSERKLPLVGTYPNALKVPEKKAGEDSSAPSQTATGRLVACGLRSSGTVRSFFEGEWGRGARAGDPRDRGRREGRRPEGHAGGRCRGQITIRRKAPWPDHEVHRRGSCSSESRGAKRLSPLPLPSPPRQALRRDLRRRRRVARRARRPRRGRAAHEGLRAGPRRRRAEHLALGGRRGREDHGARERGARRRGPRRRLLLGRRLRGLAHARARASTAAASTTSSSTRTAGPTGSSAAERARAGRSRPRRDDLRTARLALAHRPRPDRARRLLRRGGAARRSSTRRASPT